MSNPSCPICPECGAIGYYDSYRRRNRCTRCYNEWASESEVTEVDPEELTKAIRDWFYTGKLPMVVVIPVLKMFPGWEHEDNVTIKKALYQVGCGDAKFALSNGQMVLVKDEDARPSILKQSLALAEEMAETTPHAGGWLSPEAEFFPVPNINQDRWAWCKVKMTPSFVKRLRPCPAGRIGVYASRYFCGMDGFCWKARTFMALLCKKSYRLPMTSKSFCSISMPTAIIVRQPESI